MPGHRFFFPFTSADKNITLDDVEEFGHLARVLRLQAGDAVELVNGHGGVASGIIEDVSRSSARIVLRDVSFVERPGSVRISLACAIPKKAKFEMIIEKCTELGADRIVPVVTQRTESIVDAERAQKKAERFRRVAVNASKQCKRLWFPEIVAPLSFEQALCQLSGPDVKMFIPWLEGARVPLAEAVAGRGPGCKEVVFFIGPEGDFTPDEAALAVRSGAVPVSLGENVLKVDTAAMSVVAFVKFLL